MWQWGKTFLAILGAIATVVGVAAIWGLYPIGLIVLLLVALVAALWVLYQRDKSSGTVAATPDPRVRRHDSWIVAEVRKLVPRRNIEWLRTWDFGAAWQASLMDPFFQLEHLNDVEHRPLDAELAVALERLFQVTDELAQLHAVNSFPDKNSQGWADTGWSDVEGGKYGKHRDLFQERRELLNNAADPVAATYDEFIDIARHKLLLEAADEDVAEPII
jgi:hypothetical protein